MQGGRVLYSGSEEYARTGGIYSLLRQQTIMSDICCRSQQQVPHAEADHRALSGAGDGRSK
jgi:hypothetical protein